MTSIAPDIFYRRLCRLSVRHMESTSLSLLVRTSLQLSFSAPARVRLRSTASRRWVGAGRGRGHLQRKVAAKFVPRAKQTWLPPRWVWSEEGRKQKGDGDTQGRRTYTLRASCLLFIKLLSQLGSGTTLPKSTSPGKELSQFPELG